MKPHSVGIDDKDRRARSYCLHNIFFFWFASKHAWALTCGLFSSSLCSYIILWKVMHTYVCSKSSAAWVVSVCFQFKGTHTHFLTGLGGWENWLSSRIFVCECLKMCEHLNFLCALLHRRFINFHAFFTVSDKYFVRPLRPTKHYKLLKI